MTNRRDFLKTSAAALAGLVPVLDACSRVRPAAAAPRKLNILVLGGTGFIGPYQVRYAVARGHQVTVFNRGKHQADLPASVEHLQGDRNGQLDALRGRKWDAVIDNSATTPDWVRQSAGLLKDAAGQYVYVSSTGVYYPYRTVPVDETTPVKTELADPNDGSAKFGVAKAQCEREAQAAFGDRATIVRPHFIVGPGDTSDRFPYWPVRVAAGGEVLVPGRRSDPVQFIDARDLAEWMVRLVEQRNTGIYNAAGPRGGMTMEQFVNGVRSALGSSATWTWVDDYDFLEQHQMFEIVPWILLRGDLLGMTSVKFDRALATGLTYRPFADTVRDTLTWWRTVIPETRRQKPRFSMTPEKEAELLAAWKQRTAVAR